MEFSKWFDSRASEAQLEVRFSKKAQRSLNPLDRVTKQRIREGIKGLLQHPPKGDIKVMQGQPTGVYRLRIGKYRIIYEIVSDTLRILDIGSRGDIYK